MTPRFEPEFIFTIAPVTLETDCMFCPTSISPVIDDWMVHIGFPGKTAATTHPACFEQLAWSMTRFVFDNKGDLLPERASH